MGLHKQDAKIFLTYTNDVSRVAAQLRDLEAEAKPDREKAGVFRRMAEDLEHVTGDLVDTIGRL